MKIYSFFKLLNKKIKEYDNTYQNPFTIPHRHVTIIWIEDFYDEKNKN